VLVIITCSACGGQKEKERGQVNRTLRSGGRLYCGLACAGVGKRVVRSAAAQKAIKRLYDLEYNRKNSDVRCKQRAEWFQKTYDPEKAKIERETKKKEKPELEAKRREYMKSKQYRGQKKKYDRRYRAYKTYGKAWGECMALTLDIRDECLTRMSDYQIRKANGTLSKSQQRRKDYERLNSNKSENCPMGNA